MSLGGSSVNVTRLGVFGCSWLNLESKVGQCDASFLRAC